MTNKSIDDEKELLRIKCVTLAVMLLASLFITITSIFLLYDLFDEVIDLSMSGDKDKESILEYVRAKFFLLYSLFSAWILIIFINGVVHLRKKLRLRDGGE